MYAEQLGLHLQISSCANKITYSNTIIVFLFVWEKCIANLSKAYSLKNYKKDLNLIYIDRTLKKRYNWIFMKIKKLLLYALVAQW